MAEILTAASRKPNKTKIMYQANLSSRLLKKYLAEASRASLIFFEDETKRYALTSKGKEFLEAYMQYSRSNRHAEKIIEEVNSKKQTLEKLFSINTGNSTN
jgi:predicted transcriptional regulator